MKNDNTKPHIIWLHTHFLSNTGGTRFVFEVAVRLKKHFNIEIFVEKASTSWIKKFNDNGIKVNTLLPLTSTNVTYWLALSLWLSISLKKLHSKTQGSDVVITSMFPMNYLANKLNKPHIQVCFEPFAFFHDPQYVNSFSIAKQVFIRLLSCFYKKLDIKATQKAITVTTPNQGVADMVEEIYKKTISNFTYIGVDTNLFKPNPDEKLAQKFAHQKIIMHSTDYTAIKGTDLLIKILPEIAKKITHFKVIITESTSDHSAKAKLIKLAKSLNVDQYLYFTGPLPYIDLPKYYSQADVYAFTGNPVCQASSSASLSVLESLACQTPVVRSIGTRDEVIDSKSGFVVDPRQKKKFAQKVVFLLNHPKLANRMGQWGRIYIQNNYTWDHVTNNLISQITKNVFK